MTTRLKWASGGGEATIVAISADAVSLVSSVPWPPGARVEGVVDVEGGPATLKIKVHGSKKQADGSFAIEGRPVDMPRLLREKLAGK
jgi:hypothetical protein